MLFTWENNRNADWCRQHGWTKNIWTKSRKRRNGRGRQTVATTRMPNNFRLHRFYFVFNYRLFTKMPSEHYMIEAKLILQCAPEDVPHAEEIRTVIKDICDIRAAKLRTSMDDFIKGEGTYAKIDNLTVFEIHSVRPLLPHSLDLIDRLHKATAARPTQLNQSSASFSFNATWTAQHFYLFAQLSIKITICQGIVYTEKSNTQHIYFSIVYFQWRILIKTKSEMIWILKKPSFIHLYIRNRTRIEQP